MELFRNILLLLCFADARKRALVPQFDVKEEIVSVVEGEHAVLSCSIKNLGPRMVVWKSANQEYPLTFGEVVYADNRRISIQHQLMDVDKEEWNLHIHDVLPKDSGIYNCMITGTTIMTKYVTLEVKESEPVPKLDVKEETGSVFTGEHAVLSCSSEKIGTRLVEWRHEDVLLTVGTNRIVDDSRFSIEHQRTEMDKDEWNLHIRDVLPKDRGIYTCMITDKDTNISKTVNLEVDGGTDLSTQSYPTSSTDVSDTSVSTAPLTTEAQSSKSISKDMLKETRIEYYRERILTDRKRRKMMDLQAIYFRTVIDYIQKQGNTDGAKNFMKFMSP